MVRATVLGVAAVLALAWADVIQAGDTLAPAPDVGVVSVRTLPGGDRLKVTFARRNGVGVRPMSERFQVVVRNSGPDDVENARVRITLRQPGEKSVTLTPLIKRIPAGKWRAAKFWGFHFERTDFKIGKLSTLRVVVVPILGEADLDDKARSYNMTFALS